MDVSVLTKADYLIDKCGRPRPPRADLSVVPIVRSFLADVFFPASTTSTVVTYTKEITGETLWCMVGFQCSSSAGTAISFQVLLPSGRYLVNNLQDITQVGGYGSYRFAFKNPLRCPPGSRVQIIFQVTDTTLGQPMAVLFDGYYEFLLQGGANRVCPADEIAADLPRYFGHANQNIMAPFWQHGVSREPTPAGFRDDDFTYSSLQAATSAFPAGAPGSSISVTAANMAAVQQIGIDNAEFHCERVLIEVHADEAVTAGSVLARLRLGSGFAFFDDYLDAARYIGSARYPLDWIIPANDIVYADLLAVDVAGAGNIYWTMFLDGFKRKRLQ